MRRKFTVLFVTLLIVVLVVSGCSGKGDNLPDNISNEISTPALSTTKNSSDTETVSVNSDDGKIELTSVEAVMMAYAEAEKWRSDAVLWWMMPVAAYLDEDWENTDISYEWAFIFVCESDNKRFTVNIDGGEVTDSEEETHFFREIDIPDGILRDRPHHSMKEAGALAISYSMPEHISPMILYTVENSDAQWNGRPVWEFIFGIDDEIYQYIIDDMDGTLLGIFDKDGLSTNPPDKQAEPEMDASETLKSFLTALNSGDTDIALNMLAEDKISGPDNKAMWEQSLKSVKSLNVISIEESFKEEWNEIREYYKCTLKVSLNADAQPGLWEDGEIVRWFSLTLTDGRWAISEISMNP